MVCTSFLCGKQKYTVHTCQKVEIEIEMNLYTVFGCSGGVLEKTCLTQNNKSSIMF